MIVIAHLSDVHLDGDRRAADRTRAVMEYLDALPYDLHAVLVSGDIADHAADAEYEEAAKLLRSRHPLVVCPGNHDERAAFRRGLLGETSPSTEPVDQVLRGDGFVLAVCDSSVPGEDHGFLEESTLAWLDGVLTETPPETPVLVAFHHPPVPLNTPYVDGIRQFGEERLAALAERHPHLTAFLCGHAHTAAATTFAGRPVLVAPGVVSTLRLPWEAPTGSSEHVHLDEPPAVAFHVIGDDGRLTTHYRVIADRR
ncbi:MULTISPECIES: metallophosphoesterase [Streptomyces]|uniref:3',5'-cyclic adenosine monophosphate phosphodiesterase CpdA n=1 Tax=Streptomyces spororaveus TaxID=284039 RepID=A0ABQ3T7E6_9ACTN|nr:metallophosphoesterase [Streptomyces spororaveus]MCM9083404.1 metallophosphoesterase [Streptomyces spororaveus]GHI76317.1 3',5'-cyclic adenosine monophosphate phosphodiesterase CpdA [Streptomyces spororaveus]